VVFVGNLPWDVVWQELKDFARSCAGVEVARADVPLNDAGRSRGFGILEFASAGDAAKAISSLNGIEFKGNEVVYF
jgi:RNA recognition motif-containing protein